MVSAEAPRESVSRAYERSTEIGMPHRSLSLNAEERRALNLSARGLGVTEVAEAMGTSSEVVRVWLASAIDVLGAHSKLEAVLMAARRGEIDLSS